MPGTVTGEYPVDWLAVLLAGLLGLAMVAIALLISRILAPRLYSRAKSQSYECGIEPMGENWSQFHIRYYLFALIFVIFDVEVVFLFPWAVVFKAIGPFAFVEMLLFIGILLFGLVYAWRRGVLQWR